MTQERATITIPPYFDEFLALQKKIKQKLELSNYEATIVALQYMHTLTMSESVDLITEKLEDMIEIYNHNNDMHHE